MKKLFTLILCLGLGANCFAQTVSADELVGLWLTEGGKAAIQIYKEAGKYNGKISWMKNPNNEEGKPKVDKNNPDKSKRSTPILGLHLLNNFVFNGENKWEKGTIYDPDNGKDYSCKITFVSHDKIEVRGYIGVSLLGRTQNWIRVPTDKK
jgi:uncharacterized protein (DUF2147 family)